MSGRSTRRWGWPLAAVLCLGLTLLVAPSGASAQEEGSALYQTNCAACHGADGRGTEQAPSLAAAAFPGMVEGKIRAGGGGMPAFVDMPGEERIPIIARYVAEELAQAEARKASSAEGGRIFRLYCAGCHGTTGRGGALTSGNAPSFKDMPGANALSAMITGPGNMPAFAGSTLDVAQQAAVARYVQVLVEPPSPGGLGLGYWGPVSEGLVAFLALAALILISIWLAWGKGGDERGRG